MTIDVTNAMTIVGNLTREPELRFTPGGVPIVSMGVAVNHRYGHEQGRYDPLSREADHEDHGTSPGA